MGKKLGFRVCIFWACGGFGFRTLGLYGFRVWGLSGFRLRAQGCRD